MKKSLLGALTGALLIGVMSQVAHAHVTVQPNEAIVGSFSRFVVRVPNESDKASTTKITVQLPPLAFVSFEPKEGWKRQTKTVTLDEPIEAFGQEITETVGTVIWSGGKIGPGEFDEFGFSARMPEEEGPIEFKAIQTYSDGEVARWTGAADSETPAATVTTYDLGTEEGVGQLGALAEMRESQSADAPAEAETGGDEGGEGSDTGTLLGGGALVVSLMALALSLRPRKS